MKERSAIVFGGAGFIGCHFLRRLAQSRPLREAFQRRHSGLRASPMKVCTTSTATSAIPFRQDLCGNGPFDIFNFAAVHTTPGHEDWEYYWTNVHGATNVCRFASDVGAEYVLFTSTMMVYGPTEAPKDEEARLEPVNAYGRSKILAEGVHRLWQSERPDRRRLTIVRPGVIYGLAERGNFTRLARALNQRRFVYPGRSDTIKACGYINDLVSSMIQVNDHNDGVFLYNFCHPQRYTSKDICAAFSRLPDIASQKFSFRSGRSIRLRSALNCFRRSA